MTERMGQLIGKRSRRLDVLPCVVGIAEDPVDHSRVIPAAHTRIMAAEMISVVAVGFDVVKCLTPLDMFLAFVEIAGHR